MEQKKVFSFSIAKSFAFVFATDWAEGIEAPLPILVWAPGTEKVKTISLTMESYFIFHPPQK